MEIDIIADLGGRFLYGQHLGRDVDIDELFQRGYNALFPGPGCKARSSLGVAREEAARDGYYSGIDFLLKVHDLVDGTAPLTLDGDVFVVGGDIAPAAPRRGSTRWRQG